MNVLILGTSKLEHRCGFRLKFIKVKNLKFSHGITVTFYSVSADPHSGGQPQIWVKVGKSGGHEKWGTGDGQMPSIFRAPQCFRKVRESSYRSKLSKLREVLCDQT